MILFIINLDNSVFNYDFKRTEVRMKKNTKKVLIIILILICLFFVFIPKNVYASNFSIEKIMTSVKDFLSQGSSSGSSDVTEEITAEVQPIINTLYWVGIAIVIGAAMFLGMEYFKATGDPKQKAEIKGKLIGFLISAAVLIAAYPIWSFLVGFITKIVN